MRKQPMQSQSARKEHNRAVAELIGRLLSHYSVGKSHEPQRAQIEDWLEDVAEFPLEVVRQACINHRQGSHHYNRPMSGDIRRLCIEIETERQERAQSAALGSAEQRAAKAEHAERERQRHTEAQREGRDIANRWAQERGFSSIDEYASAKGVHWSSAYVECITEILSAVRRVPGEPSAQYDIKNLQRDLGVNASESKPFNPTPEKMRKAREELNIPEPGE